MKIRFKIKKLETFTNTYVSAVKLTMFDDSIGWGQMSTYCSDITCDIFHRQIAPHAIGVSLCSFRSINSSNSSKEPKEIPMACGAIWRWKISHVMSEQ